ncbi:MAG TPA: cytochrome C [Nitrosospira sp.]|nr:cytochrome C [Nitrosospira sp.]
MAQVKTVFMFVIAALALSAEAAFAKNDRDLLEGLENWFKKNVRDVEEGHDIWFKSTFGGERFFSLILPNPPFNLPLGFDQMLTSPRDSRFNEYGVINDPDCTAGDATTGYLDKCADPQSAGVIGIRKFPNPSGGAPLIGVACAACHAGFDPVHPPANPNHPHRKNIHPTIGNQYLQIGKIFKANLSPHDPRYQIFSSWPQGTVDTTAIESDHINNPGMITPIWSVPDRPFFDVTINGEPARVHRNGQGGEDDAGCELAAIRVYFNIGMCAGECMVGHLSNGPGGSQTPIDLAACRKACPELVQAEESVGKLCAFLQIPRPPRLVHAPRGRHHVDWEVVGKGKKVFSEACASCHSNRERLVRHNVLSDDLIHPVSEIGTNSCRARTTNWTAGHIWAPFSSDEYKARPTGGPGFYRDMPLVGIWATAPFFHNNRLGQKFGDPSVAGRIAAYEDAMDLLLNPEKRDEQGSIQRASDSVQLPTASGVVTLPAGTPIAQFANVDPNSGTNLCPDLVENQGHHFGAELSEEDKYALREFLKTR